MSTQEVAKAMGLTYRYDERLYEGSPRWRDNEGDLRGDPTVDDILVWLQEKGWPLDTVVHKYDETYEVKCYNAARVLEEDGEIYGEASTLWEALAQIVVELGES